MIVIEKEDVVKAFTYYADQVGFALLNTRGYLTEYAETLVKKIKENGCNVSILTDFDIYGMKIATEQVPDIPRIGIDFDTLQYFRLSRDDPTVKDTISEINEYHFRSFEKLMRKKIATINSSNFVEAENLESTIKYLHNNRVEINSVLAKVGPERFWKFVIHKMTEIYPRRDYNRGIETKPDAQSLLSKVRETIDYIQSTIETKLEAPQKEIESELKQVKGILNVNDKEDEIKQRYKAILNNDVKIQDIINKLHRLAID